jgi:Transposase DDE domain
MGTTLRRIRKFVQKSARLANLDPEELELASATVAAISRNETCLVSEVARTLGGDEELRKIARPFYDGLSRKRSKLDALPDAWLRLVAPTADRMPFIAVDPSDIAKPHGKAFDNLDVVRDASDRDKRKIPGFHTVQIEATDERHRNLPLRHEVFSTVAPGYPGWYETIGRAVEAVLEHVGSKATWLFDRGCDAGDFYDFLSRLRITWVVRQLQTRNVIFGDGRTVLMAHLAASLNKRHDLLVSYVHKKTHEVRCWPVRFGFAPVRLPGTDGRLWMIVVTGLREQDMVLLTNDDLSSPDRAARIILAYMRRWGIEEGVRCWKQKTGVEGFRVRNWNSIRRLTFLSMLAYGIQALWLIACPASARRLIARVKVFIEKVLFLNYRLWDGVKDALLSGA